MATKKAVLVLFVTLAVLLWVAGCGKTTGTQEDANQGESSQQAENQQNTEQSTEQSTENAGQEILKIGLEATYPPFNFKDPKTGELTGYDVDVVREVAKRIGLEAEFYPTEWKNMFVSLDSKRFDIIANQVTITEERKKTYDFSTPYTYSGGQVIVHKENTDIKGLQDLKGKKVGTTQGSNYAEIAEKAGAELVYYKGAAQVLADLAVNRIDAALNDRLFVLLELPKTDYPLQAVGEQFNTSEMAFAFRKGNEELVEKVNQALDEMKKDGTLSELSKKWFGEDVSE